MTTMTNGTGAYMPNGDMRDGADRTMGAGQDAGGRGKRKGTCRNRWSRGCLYTALGALIIGAVLCGAGWLLGGFRQLDGLDIKGLTGIPFVYNGHAFGFAFTPHFGHFGDDDWEGRYAGWSRLTQSVEAEDGLMGGVRLDLTADTLRELSLETDGCRVVIEESADDHVRFTVEGDTERFRYLVQDGALRIAYEPGGFGIYGGSIRIRLPRGTYLERLSADVGAGRLDCGGMNVCDADIEVGAGACAADRIAADGTVTLSVGAGEIVLDSLVCREADICVNMGDLVIDDAVVADRASVELGMGDVEIGGEVNGDLDVDCSMGDVTLFLRGAQEEHDYEIDCSMGTVEIGTWSFSAMTEHTIDNGTGSDYEIDCSMGTVEIIFDAAGNADRR